MVSEATPRALCYERSRIRKNSDVFVVVVPNSHEFGDKETALFAPREVKSIKHNGPADNSDRAVFLDAPPTRPAMDFGERLRPRSLFESPLESAR